MDCPSCQGSNEPGAKFCKQCGASLVRACPGCDHANAPDARFCDQCGIALTGTAQTDTAASGPSPTETAREGERRQATVMFSDLSGFTAMSERLDPEEVEGIMGRIKAEAVRIVERHGGMVNQFVGDEVLALFGIPTAHEDDPVRAVRAARELHALIRELSPEYEPSVGAPLRMHTGINTGLVVTATGDQRDGTYGVTGDTVNTAARLVAEAATDEILLGPVTHGLAAPYFETEQKPPVKLKGKAEPLTPHAVLGESAVTSRLDAAEQRGLTRFVGRERELSILQDCLAAATSGQGQAVTIVGEAGLGKSRLLHEFRKTLDLEHINLAIGRCSATGTEHAYYPIQDLFKRWFGITDTDSPADMEAKTEAALNAMDGDLAGHLPALLHLLSIVSERALPATLAGEVVQRRVQAALKACLAASSAAKPLVMILEDLHWMDANSEAVVRQFVEALPALRVLMLLNYRPEYHPGWSNLGHVTPVALRPLGEEATGTIVASTLGADTVPAELTTLIHARTEGNPFFAEEVTLSLLEEGVIARVNGSAVLTRPVTEIHFPNSLHAIVSARIDRLDEAQRDTLRLASVVGREFTENLVTRLSELKEQAAGHLEGLKSLEMILETRFQPELEFMFKHAITHQVAYDSLLLTRRKALHKLVGQGIEELYAERLPEFYEMLAHHFDQGEMWAKAVEYHTQAGIKAARNFSIETALAAFARAQAILGEHSPDVPVALEFQLCMNQGQTLGDRVRWADGLPPLERACAIAEQLGDLPLQVQATLALTQSQLYCHDYFKALDTLGALEPMTVDVPDLHVGVLAMKWFVGLIIGDVAIWNLRDELERLIPTVASSPLLPSALYYSSLAHRFSGNPRAAIQILEKLVPAAKQVATTNRYLSPVWMYGVALGEAGRFQEAINTLEEGKAFGLDAGELYATPKVINSLGWAYHELCNYGKALENNRLALEMIGTESSEEATHRMEIVTMTTVNLAENHQMMGRMDEARRLLQALYDETEAMEFIWNRERWKMRLLMVWGEIDLAEGDPISAQNRLDEARRVKFLDSAPYLKYQIRGGRLQGNIHTANEKYGEAEAALKQALERAHEFGSPTQLWRTRQALGNLYRLTHRDEEARAQFTAARDIVQSVADGLTGQELKQGFLDSAPIREVFSQAEG